MRSALRAAGVQFVSQYGPKPKSAETRFWKLVRKTESCWLWTGFLDSRGRGRFYVGPERSAVHAYRFAYEVTKGDPGDQQVCHTCDNPRCVNPDHLWLGSAKENIADMLAKGRGLKGELNGHARLTAKQAKAIRILAKSGGMTFRDIGSLFGVKAAYVSEIHTGKAWAHLLHD